MIGDTISHYVILENLGRGGMGVVYKARDTRLDRLVAIKFLPPHSNQDAVAKRRFVQEAKAASAIDHPNIGTIHEIDETDDGQIFIVMAYCEGETLSEKLARDRPDFNTACDIVVQIAEGLAEAHRKGIVHRDIKPSNILVTDRGRAVVIDFGLAKLAAQTRLTTEGATVGTAAYMSPEQARGISIDNRTDIWSLGVVLYEMLAGRHPFRGEYNEALLYSIVHDDPEDLGNTASDAPRGIEKILRKALAKEPENRYSRVEELAGDLRKLQARQDASTVTGGASRERRSIAVLPFVDMSPQKDQEYFCDGIAEELINALAHIEPLRVAARTSAFSFKGRNSDVREIGEKLNVDTVLEGSIRKAGNRLRITAQLVSATDGYHLWSEKYDRDMEDIFAVQDEISLAIVDRLKIELLGEEASMLVKRGTENLEAYDLYMRGRFFWEQRGYGLKKSIQFFEASIEKDPNYAAPHAGMADSYSMLSFYGFMPARQANPIARKHALKALEIDETNAEAHSALGWIHQFYDWNGDTAEKEFKRAIEANPAYTPAHYWYSASLFLAGRWDEGMRENKNALEVDPLSVHAHTQFGWNLCGMRRCEESIALLKRALELNPDYALANWLLGANYFLLSRRDEAIAEYQQAVKSSNRSPWMLSWLGFAYSACGQTQKAREVLAELTARSKSECVQSLFFAVVYAGLGEDDEAFAWLERSFENRDGYLIAISTDPTFESLRNDPRFRTLVEKINRAAE